MRPTAFPVWLWLAGDAGTRKRKDDPLSTVLHLAARGLRGPAALITPLSLAAIGALSIIAPVSAQDATATPSATQAGVLSTPAATIDCSDTATPSASAAAAATYTIVSDKSQASYQAQEQLAGKGANTAIGSTNAFIGTIMFDSSGMPLACSRFDVDLRTLKSDESRRDNFLYSNTLETGTYPLATFILTSVEGMSGPLADGQETNFTLIGNLTIHGVTKLVAWDATVTKNGDTITGTATTNFSMPDFNITPPKVGPVLSLDENVTLKMEITATQA
jgi:polyisoprenoid-binding protein YceI